MATKQPILLVITVIFGVVIGAVVSSFFEKNHAENNKGENKLTAVDENKPLYWVAPMDANFRRDKPGKSPMGMDLIPVLLNLQQLTVLVLSAFQLK